MRRMWPADFCRALEAGSGTAVAVLRDEGVEEVDYPSLRGLVAVELGREEADKEPAARPVKADNRTALPRPICRVVML